MITKEELHKLIDECDIETVRIDRIVLRNIYETNPDYSFLGFNYAINFNIIQKE